MLLAAGGAAYATYDYTKKYEGQVLPGAVISGVDVGGMAYDEALEAVKAAIAPQLDREIEVSYEGKTWEVTPRELGARSDARKAVNAALEASSETSFVSRMQMRVFGSELSYTRGIAIKYPRSGVNAFIAGIASGFDRPVRETSLDYSTGTFKIVQARDGREVKLSDSRRALLDALYAEDDEAELAVKVMKPTEDPDKYHHVLYLNQSERHLYLYTDGKVSHDWVIAVGTPSYPTPTGEYEVVEKRYMPTWVNPAPDGWGADMPDMIPPGISNPLGLRAINWNADGIRFHGTTATYSLGTAASHGCVRMSNDDVIQLYDLIDVGTPIISIY